MLQEVVKFCILLKLFAAILLNIKLRCSAFLNKFNL
jgi:hypothetical protein